MKLISEQINPKFVNQAKKLTRITQFLHQILPIECRKHVQVSNIRQQILILVTDSPVWTTRLRQLSPQILQYIHQNSQKFEACLSDSHPAEHPGSNNLASNKLSSNKQLVHHIQISTRYHTQHSNELSSITKKASNRPKISKNTAELLSQSAKAISHPQLKTALLKLASHNHSDTDKYSD